jgi:hypothetical protein
MPPIFANSLTNGIAFGKKSSKYSTTKAISNQLLSKANGKTRLLGHDKLFVLISIIWHKMEKVEYCAM